MPSGVNAKLRSVPLTNVSAGTIVRTTGDGTGRGASHNAPITAPAARAAASAAARRDVRAFAAALTRRHASKQTDVGA